MRGDIAHVFNRGVDKRQIFLDEGDYLRFLSSLVLLNNKEGKIRTESKNIFPVSIELASKQKKLVEILRWSLLPNHYHLLISEIEEGGISEFTRRLGNSYTKYFNNKYQRSGYLFQNKVQIVPVTENSQMLYLPVYIDLNCIDLRFNDWKQRGRSYHHKEMIKFLKSYKWADCGHYFASNPFFNIANHNLFNELFDTNLLKYEKELTALMKEPFGIDGVDETNPSTWHVDGWQNSKKKVR